MASILQRIFRRPDYSSDVTQFIEQLKTEKPDLEAQQRAGRAIWWDKHIDRELMNEWKQSRVPAKPYAYGDDPRQRR
ncbi:DUF3460 family protein [Ramlibacter alkalitolerans]|jgi:hypothetical protein|uniref:DUF3460 family protein n=1 Tax=Ramlibacter alkalitolerans TaxID=2039631 RepID=A0ABS1JPW3_9BURK|nr:DUF3460 family protein [Ramlibacter alkalitolerans]MBL0426299.1 DUF3460 family protein [Ramlibacter alkalitolerans]